jgi:hypothetical protein
MMRSSKMTSKRQTAEAELQSAVAADQNLEVLKATRRVISEYLADAEEPGDQAKFLTLLLKVNSDIIKIEGKKQVMSDEEEADYAELEEMRNGFGGKNE